MSDSEQDTETLLAILSSLLDHPLPQQDVLLNALAHANGNIDGALDSLRRGSRSLNSNLGPQTTRKRAATGVLDDWLTPAVARGSQITKKYKPNTTPNHSPVKVLNEPSVSPRAVESRRRDITPQKPSSSSVKPLVPFTDVLRPPPPTSPVVPQLVPLTLSNPAMVEKHTPCTLHPCVLPSELACRLFHTMVDASKEWKPNKWWLFDRVVESPHRTSFYARRSDGVNDDSTWQEAAKYWYNGRVTSTPPVFPPEMEEACQLIEKVVNKVMQTRSRYPLEWGGTGSDGHAWKANVAASNCYTGGKEGVGFHSDQLTYLGPFPTIASLSLGTTRVFRLREVIPKSETAGRQAQTFNIPVAHNSLVIMHASTQERFKHSIPLQRAVDVFHPKFPSHINPDSGESNCRINITFRFYRPDFRPPSIPVCMCGVPCILRADMKGRKQDEDGVHMRYLWMCYAGAQNDGKGCSFVKLMDCKSEGRGPLLKDCP
ncbi:hypothetical protein K439DRAFT_1355796 [Ramaria rubella]|nr:hypothetical protein K439DRAFT_1355796 [Ramaria rubella]